MNIRYTAIPRPKASGENPFTVAAAEAARSFHSTLPGYAPTPLVTLRALASRLGIDSIAIKDESRRFNLDAFKSLGASFAMNALANGRSALTFVTATDGNHGRGVAWAARLFGHRAVVYMPKGSSPERLENIRALGAAAEITELSYDDCVRYASRMAEENGWILIQDTDFDGYYDVPRLIMQGYTTMGIEISDAWNGPPPTHIFLQAGVGAMAGAMSGFFADLYGEARPTVVIVEPTGADCIYRTAAAGDGQYYVCRELNTIMAGLSCGEVCTVAYDILSRHADYVVACPDSVSKTGMRLLAHPEFGDDAVISGESGAVCVGLVFELMTSRELAELRARLSLNDASRVLCISTEGATDKAVFEEITGISPV